MIRWICEKDNKKWIYPVEKCIYCKGPVKKQISKKAKIIGITKVNIPSPMHPIIPYNVVLLEDEYGNRMPKKTMKDYKIGDKYEIKKANTDGAVIITKIKYDMKESLIQSLELLNNDFVSQEDKVLIKASIIEPAYEYQATTTSPKLLEALITWLKKKKVKDIVIAEQSIIPEETMAAAKKSGILAVCKKHEIKFIDLSESEFVEKETSGFNFRISKDVMDRKVINVPVMKTNSQIGISGAMENMVRVADKETQNKMYGEDIEKTLPKLIGVFPKFLSIGDATIGMHGQGPTVLGEPAFLNMLFVSKRAVSLDKVFAQASMLEIPDYVNEALKNENIDSKEIEIVGDELEAVKFQLNPAQAQASAHSKIRIIDGKANPYTFHTALKMSSKLVGLLGEEIHLVIGTKLTKDMLENKKRLVVYGNDAIQKVRELDVKVLAEIPEDIDNLEKVMLLKNVLENPDKKRITARDKLKSKVSKLGAKIKSSL